MSDVSTEAARRRTFAIISHPDAGKTTLTEKLLLFGGAIQMAGSVKGRKAARHATSDWMALEKERGISVTSSVMQFPYEGRIVNLLDTPGHADFGEDTYRVLTAVDSALMVIDVRQGRRGTHDQADGSVPPARHADHDLHQQARPRGPGPDRPARRDRIGARHPVRAGDLADRHGLAPEGRGAPAHRRSAPVRTGPQLHPPGFDDLRVARRSRRWRRASARTCWRNCATNWNWCRAPRIRSIAKPIWPASRRRCSSARRVNNFGVQLLLDFFVEHAPSPQRARDHHARGRSRRKPSSPASCSRSRPTWTRSTATASRSCASARASFEAGMKALHVRTGKEVKLANALTFMASDREIAESAYPGDVIGIHNHGTHLDRRHLHRRREAQRSPASRTSRRNCSAARACAIRSSSSNCRRAWRSCPKKARPSSSAR